MTRAKATGRRWPILAAAAMLAVLPGAGEAQTARRPTPTPTPSASASPSAGKEMKHIVTQPARDVGIAKTRIPQVLLDASADPYGMDGAANCRQIAGSIGALTGVLGPDYESLPGKRRDLVRAGGEAALGLIPFRGAIRELSGAAPAERRYQAAVQAGFARRGFLRGLQRARGCR